MAKIFNTSLNQSESQEYGCRCAAPGCPIFITFAKPGDKDLCRIHRHSPDRRLDSFIFDVLKENKRIYEPLRHAMYELANDPFDFNNDKPKYHALFAELMAAYGRPDWKPRSNCPQWHQCGEFTNDRLEDGGSYASRVLTLIDEEIYAIASSKALNAGVSYAVDKKERQKKNAVDLILERAKSARAAQQEKLNRGASFAGSMHDDPFDDDWDNMPC